MSISDEAVEDAAKAFRETELYDDALMNALEAAAPHMLNLAKREAWDANLEIQRLRGEQQEKLAQAWERGRVDGYHHRPNPYKENQ